MANVEDLLHYTIKGTRHSIRSDDGYDRELGFVSLLFESCRPISYRVEDSQATEWPDDPAESVINDYETARSYGAIFSGHTLPETVAGFAVCNYETGTCDLIFANFRVGSILADYGKDDAGNDNFRTVTTFWRNIPSINEGDPIQAGAGIWRVSSSNMYNAGGYGGENAELYAAVHAACNALGKHDVKDSGGARRI